MAKFTDPLNLRPQSPDNVALRQEILKQAYASLPPGSGTSILSHYTHEGWASWPWVPPSYLNHPYSLLAHQSYPKLCDPIDGSPPGSSVPGIPIMLPLSPWFGILPLNNILCNYVCVLSHSVVSDSVTPWTVVRRARLSTGFSRQGY